VDVQFKITYIVHIHVTYSKYIYNVRKETTTNVIINQTDTNKLSIDKKLKTNSLSVKNVA